jgi:hypothetical protein
MLALALLGVAAAWGCNEQPLPGTVYGMYKVTAQTKVNSCGVGLNAPNPWVFDAQLSQEGSTLYWSWMDGNSPLSGPIVSSTHQASITTNLSANVDATDAGLGPCNLARADDLELTLASGSPPPSFTGTITYSFTVPGGSSCGDQLTSAGGTYDALPCSLSYTVSAAKQ